MRGTKSHKTTTRDASTDTASKGEEEGGVASFRIEEPRVRGPGVQKQFGMSHAEPHYLGRRYRLMCCVNRATRSYFGLFELQHVPNPCFPLRLSCAGL